jgi:hypothetical protein
VFFVGDFGLAINIRVVDSAGNGVPLNGATATEYELEDPDRNVSTVTASFVTDGTDGRLTYVLQSGDLNEVGVWKVRAKITEGASKQFHTERFEFPVEP